MLPRGVNQRHSIHRHESDVRTMHWAPLRTLEAATRLVGRRSITSLAKDGPERKHVGWAWPSALGTIWAMVSPVPSSSPFDTQMMGRLGLIRGLTPFRNFRECWHGTASRANWASLMASSASNVARKLEGSSYSCQCNAPPPSLICPESKSKHPVPPPPSLHPDAVSSTISCHHRMMSLQASVA